MAIKTVWPQSSGLRKSNTFFTTKIRHILPSLAVLDLDKVNTKIDKVRYDLNIWE